jgi:hypothetical protein
VSAGASDDGGRDGQRSDVERAEDLIEVWGERIGGWLATTVARAREEAEDLWAEAQSVRRGERR